MSKMHIGYFLLRQLRVFSTKVRQTWVASPLSHMLYAITHIEYKIKSIFNFIILIMGEGLKTDISQVFTIFKSFLNLAHTLQ